MAYKLQHFDTHTEISHENLVKKVLKPATGTSTNSIYTNFGHSSDVSKNRGKTVKGGAVLATIKSYKQKNDINIDKAYKELDRYALEVKVAQGKKMETELEAREAIKSSKELRKAERKQKLEKMRNDSKKERIAAEQAKLADEEKKKKNIARSKESGRDIEAKNQLEDMAIDF